MKQLYELLTYPLSIIEDPFWNFVLMTIIGSLSFVVAWNFVGETGIRGKAGSILHWTVRIIVMFLLCFITSLVIKLVIFIYNIPLVTWLAIGIIVMLILLIFIVLKFTLFGKKEKKMNQIDKQKNRYIVLMKRIINYYFQYEEIYLEFKDKLKENTVSPKINGYTIKINDKKDYTEQIIYEFDLNKMKKDTKNVKIVDNTLKFKEESGEEVSINQLNEEEILSQYKELGYTCK